ncbi:MULTISPECIES: DUF1674 domain-containing protein [Brevundimonas]|uniref:DUF1674 domain-containing protein n=1 Tax=Brevundimonas abyssalis TAR-001 TaxID=1391729 RepID=A0A8E0TSQ9_9CAUL|nr:hypothetical protein MBEBAB_1811 [Brevundimonas abyssalis TAR-001]
MTDQPADDIPVLLNPDLPDAAQDKPLSPAARRALEEAAARRAAAPPLDLPPEQGGPRGAEPTRYGDWEKKGLAVDF